MRGGRSSYPLRGRTLLSHALAGQTETRGSRLLASCTEAAVPWTANALGRPAAAPVLRLDMLSTADGQPLSVATHWFDATRFAGLPAAVARTGSVTAGLAASGVDDYVRVETTIEACHATPEDLEELALSPGAIVLVTHAVNATLDGSAFQCSQTRFAADRVTLQVNHEAGEDRVSARV